jgi:hypothetical protein
LSLEVIFLCVLYMLANANVRAQPHLHLLADTRKYLCVCTRPHLPFLSDTRKYKCLRSASSSPLPSCSPYQGLQLASSFSLLRYSQMPMFALSLIFPSSQTLASTSVSRSASHSPPVRYSQILVLALSLVFPSSCTRNYQCLRSGLYSPLLRYSPVPMFALANASGCAQAHISLLSDRSS